MHPVPKPSISSCTEQSIQLTQNSSILLAFAIPDLLLGQSIASDSFDEIIAQIDKSLRNPKIATEQFESTFDCPNDYMYGL